MAQKLGLFVCSNWEQTTTGLIDLSEAHSSTPLPSPDEFDRTVRPHVFIWLFAALPVRTNSSGQPDLVFCNVFFTDAQSGRLRLDCKTPCFTVLYAVYAGFQSIHGRFFDDLSTWIHQLFHHISWIQRQEKHIGPKPIRTIIMQRLIYLSTVFSTIFERR